MYLTGYEHSFVTSQDYIREEVSMGLMDPKGYVFIDKEITHSREPGMSPLGDYSLTEDYFNALKNKMVPVMDVAVDKSSYLVLGTGELSGGFIWNIDKRDTIGEMIPYELLHPGENLEEMISGIIKLSRGELSEEELEKFFEDAERMMERMGLEFDLGEREEKGD